MHAPKPVPDPAAVPAAPAVVVVVVGASTVSSNSLANCNACAANSAVGRSRCGCADARRLTKTQGVIYSKVIEKKY